MKLNDTICKTAKPFPAPSKTPCKISDGNGLYLWVMPNGAKYWRFIYKRTKMVAFGVYPEVTLKEAREKTATARKQVAAGKDIILEKKKEKLLSIVNKANTFETIGREWYENRKERWEKRYAEDVIKRLEMDIFPEIGTYPITEIEPPMMVEVIRKIEKRGALDLARRQLQKCGEIFRYAIAEGKAVRNPAADIGEALKPVQSGHFASFDKKELPNFIQKIELNDARLYPTTRNALKLMMLTFVRTSELMNATWDEIDYDEKQWVIPAKRMKMKREHIVPLSAQSIAILKSQHEIAGQWPLIFPSIVRPRQSISNNTILGAIKRLGYKGEMTGHGFRSLAMTAIMEDLGYRFEVPDLQLAHSKGDKIRAAYDRTKFIEERTKMMQEWADYLEDKGLRC